jgi:hypothetical protein
MRPCRIEGGRPDRAPASPPGCFGKASSRLRGRRIAQPGEEPVAILNPIDFDGNSARLEFGGHCREFGEIPTKPRPGAAEPCVTII